MSCLPACHLRAGGEECFRLQRTFDIPSCFTAEEWCKGVSHLLSTAAEVIRSPRVPKQMNLSETSLDTALV